MKNFFADIRVRLLLFYAFRKFLFIGAYTFVDYVHSLVPMTDFFHRRLFVFKRFIDLKKVHHFIKNVLG